MLPVLGHLVLQQQAQRAIFFNIHMKSCDYSGSECLHPRSALNVSGCRLSVLVSLFEPHAAVRLVQKHTARSRAQPVDQLIRTEDMCCVARGDKP